MVLYSGKPVGAYAVITALRIKIKGKRKRDSWTVDRHETDALRFPVDAASVAQQLLQTDPRNALSHGGLS